MSKLRLVLDPVVYSEVMPVFWTDWNNGPERPWVYGGYTGGMEVKLGEYCRLDDREGTCAYGFVVGVHYSYDAFDPDVLGLGQRITVGLRPRRHFWYDV